MCTHTYIHIYTYKMSSKTISLKEEAYERLKKMKDGKSFSDVVMELTENSKRDFSNLIGKDVDFDWKDIKDSRKRSKKDEKREILLGH
mgnify:CR=1 FL=1